MISYSESPDLFVCPKTNRHPKSPLVDERIMPSNNNEHWATQVPVGKNVHNEGEILYGSLAPNAWIMDTKDGVWRTHPEENFWGSLTIMGGSEVPVFLDSVWVDAWPYLMINLQRQRK